MTLLPRGVKVHLAFGFIDMRKGIDGLAMLVQGVLRQDPFSGHLFVFRGRKANLIKIVFWDGTGLCLFTKRLEHGVFLWPSNVEPGGTLMLNSAQLSMLIDGVDWRAPERQWRPAVTITARTCGSISRNHGCPRCSGELHVIGETVSEMLDHVPARLRGGNVRDHPIPDVGRLTRSTRLIHFGHWMDRHREIAYSRIENTSV